MFDLIDCERRIKVLMLWLAFHKVRETIASEAMRVSHENTHANLADILSKYLGGPQHALLSSHILH